MTITVISFCGIKVIIPLCGGGDLGSIPSGSIPRCSSVGRAPDCSVYKFRVVPGSIPGGETVYVATHKHKFNLVSVVVITFALHAKGHWFDSSTR
jgi:hypothetical protein